MYHEFGDNWYAVCVRVTTVAIKDTTTDYNTIDYFENRKTIALGL